MKLGDLLALASGLLALASTVYSALLYLVSRRRRPCRIPCESRPQEQGARIVVVCPARSEPPSLLEEQWRSIVVQGAPVYYILAWSGEGLWDAWKRLRRVLPLGELLYIRGDRCKADALNMVVSCLHGERDTLLVVVDSDDVLGRGLLEKALEAYGSGIRVLVPVWAPRDWPRGGLQDPLGAMLYYGSRCFYIGKCRLGLPLLYLGSGTAVSLQLVKNLGGYSSRHLLEDLELGLRLLLDGHQVALDEEARVLVGLPPSLHAFALQQSRWARGAMQLLKSYLPRIAGSPRLKPLWKLDLVLYLSQYLAAGLAPALAMTALALGVSWQASAIALALWLAGLSVSGTAYNTVLTRELGLPWPRALRVSASSAAIASTLWLRLLLSSLQGLISPGAWTRTPKTRRGRGWLRKLAPELAGGLAAATVLAVARPTPLALIPLLYLASLLYTLARYRRQLA